MAHVFLQFGEKRGAPECNNIEGGFLFSLLFWRRGVGEAFSFLHFHHIRNTCLPRRAKASKIRADLESDAPENDSKSAESGREAQPKILGIVTGRRSVTMDGFPRET